MLDFRPPIPSPLVEGLTRLLIPSILRFRCHDLEVYASKQAIERFQKLRGKRAMICPNHSYRHDPETMLAFSKIVGEYFNFVAAREVFDYNHGFNGWLIQRMGCYSVVRGAADRESFKTTKNILVEGKRKLVLFPEGEISWQNESLLPLETGAAQLCFWALDELQKTQAEEPVFILPVALKYTYRKDVTAELDVVVSQLEKKLGLYPQHEDSLYARVRDCALKVLAAMERQYNLKVSENDSLDARMKKLKEHALHALAEVLELELPPLKSTYLDWVRVLRNAMDDFIYEDTSEMSEYERQLHDERAEKIKAFYTDLNRVVSFIAIYDGYLQPPSTQERIANVVKVLETEVFGDKSILGPRRVTIDIGEPINLLECYAAYKKNKRETIQSVTNELSRQIFSMLEGLEKEREAVYVN